ncbi:MAG: 50S ribosomal protein L6 [Acidobacteria bacterium]|nr:50S ribosomal protein L6 [Acidobacteriota bacterium]
MSRIGKKPIPLPAGVKIKIDGGLHVEGPKGKLSVPLPPGITIENDGKIVNVKRENDSFRAVHGLTRALAYNAITGVSTGFTRELDIVGVGFRAETKGKDIVHFTLGYSHAIEFLLPAGVEAKVDKNTHIILTGHDKQVLGQVAANMRALRKPDPYKNKGVRYTGEVLRKKAGKSGAGGKGK